MIFNKAMEETEELTSNLETISCVSATVLHILEFNKCANWKTTADIIQAHNSYFKLEMSDKDILKLAKKQVEKYHKNFVPCCHC